MRNEVEAAPDTVSVRYARHEYAMGYVQGRLAAGVDSLDAASFARFYVEQCDHEGEPANVHLAFDRWQADRAEVAAEIRFDRAAEYATNYDLD